MTPNEYQVLAMHTKSIYIEGDEDQICHSVVGLAGDVGELCSCVEKHRWYGQKFDKDNFIEELGDCLWYIAEACDALHIHLEAVMEANIAKLQKRYPNKFDANQAKEENRDRKAEAEAMKMPDIKIVGEVFSLPNKNKACKYCKTPFSDRAPKYCPECGVAQDG